MQNNIIPLECRIRINGLLYDQQPEGNTIVQGDLVLDLRDGAYGCCDMVHSDGKHIAIKDSYVAEVGVPITRVRKLVLSIFNSSVN